MRRRSPVCILVAVGIALCCGARPAKGGALHGHIRMAAHAYTPGLMTGSAQGSQPLVELDKLAREYESLHPAVKVTILRIPPGMDSDEWRVAQMVANVAPEILWVHADLANVDISTGRRDWYVPLDPYLEQPNPYVAGNAHWWDMFHQRATNQRRNLEDGKLYVIPVDQVTTGIFYNKDIFAKAGVTVPETWAEFMQAHQKIAVAGYIPFAWPGKVGSQWAWIYYMFNDALWTHCLDEWDVRAFDNVDLAIDGGEAVRAYLKGLYRTDSEENRTLWRLFKEWSRYFQPGFMGDTDLQADRYFRTGKAAMYWAGSGFEPGLRNDPYREFEFGIFLLPPITAETSPLIEEPVRHMIGGASANQYAITKSAVRAGTVEECVDWLMFLTEPQRLERLIFERGEYLPNIKGARIPENLTPFAAALELDIFAFGGFGGGMLEDQRIRTMQSYAGGVCTLDEAMARMVQFEREGVEMILRETRGLSLYQFDQDWDLLPAPGTHFIRDQKATGQRQSRLRSGTRSAWDSPGQDSPGQGQSRLRSGTRSAWDSPLRRQPS